jgi:hypothetical protein
MYTNIHHELHQARKAWPGTLVCVIDPCLLSGWHSKRFVIYRAVYYCNYEERQLLQRCCIFYIYLVRVNINRVDGTTPSRYSSVLQQGSDRERNGSFLHEVYACI